MEKVNIDSVNRMGTESKKETRNQVLEFEEFYENAILPLHCVDANGIVVWANHAEFDFLGYSKEEYINKHLSFFHADDIVTDDILDRLAKNQKLVNYYARLRCKSGEIKHVLINSNDFIKDGKVSHTRCFTTDITDLKKEEIRHMTLISELQEKNTRLLWKVGSVQRGYY